MDRLDMRISDTEREEVVERLRAALGEGRLELAEFDERVQSTYRAKTYRDLVPLTADLPAVPVPAPPGRVVPAGRPVEESRRALAMLSTIFVFIGLGVLLSVATGGTVLPFWPLFIVAFWGLSRRSGWSGRR
ncbi:MAG: DUF1707 domain-containing protein [Actinocatenispora sp.]